MFDLHSLHLCECLKYVLFNTYLIQTWRQNKLLRWWREWLAVHKVCVGCVKQGAVIFQEQRCENDLSGWLWSGFVRKQMVKKVATANRLQEKLGRRQKKAAGLYAKHVYTSVVSWGEKKYNWCGGIFKTWALKASRWGRHILMERVLRL